MPARQIKLEITTTSKFIPDSMPLPAAVVPVITMDGQPFPKPPPPNVSPSGFQIVVIDPIKSFSDPASIRLNAYYQIAGRSPTPSNWMPFFRGAWEEGVRGITSAGNTDQQLIFLATYGLDANMAPTTDMIATLISTGAGAPVQNWMTHVSWGSQANGWVSFPANYILVGYAALTYGQGYELYERAPSGPNPSITSKLSVTLTSPS